MSDLISRKALLAKVIDANPMGCMIGGKFIEDLIKTEPTAYDVEKVVEQLESLYVSSICSNATPCNYPHTIGCCYDKAVKKSVEIVKGAVKDE
jgi:hypothetical protein